MRYVDTTTEHESIATQHESTCCGYVHMELMVCDATNHSHAMQQEHQPCMGTSY
jgi:hypothetical protein